MEDIIKQHRRLLVRSMDPSFNFVDTLRMNDVLSAEKETEVRATASEDDKNRLILRHLLDAADDGGKCARFIESLRECGQEHVANVLEKKSEKMPMSDEHYEVLTRNMFAIEKVMDPDCGAVDELFSMQVFTDEDRQRIERTTTYNNKVSAILRTLIRKPDSCFQHFIDALQKYGQEHVQYVMDGTGSPPVRQEFIERMEKHRTKIIESMVPKLSSLLDFMITGKILHTYDRVDPRTQDEQVTGTDMNVEILRLLPRTSQATFDKFIVALITSGQEHIAKLFVGKQINGKITVTYRRALDKSAEQQVEHELKLLLSELCQNGVETKSQLRLVLAAIDVKISYLKDGCIAIGFRCYTVDALQKLRDLYDSKQLERVMTEEYQPLFADVESLRLEISSDEFDRCAASFIRNKLMSATHRHALLSAGKSQIVQDTIIITDEFLNELKLSKRLQQAIKESPGAKQIQMLFDIVSRQPDSAFDKLIEALERHQCPAALDVIYGLLSKSHNDDRRGRTDSVNKEQQEDQLEQIKKKIKAFGDDKDISTLNELNLKRQLDAALSIIARQKVQQLLSPISVLTEVTDDVSVVEETASQRKPQGETNSLYSLPVESLEIPLIKTSIRLFVKNFETSGETDDDDIRRLYATNYKSRRTMAIQLTYVTLAAVGNNLWQTLRGWPESSTKHWLKHRVQLLINNYRRGRVWLRIDSIRGTLVDIIEPDYGLLEELIEQRVLTSKQCDMIRSKTTVYDRNYRMLDFFSESAVSDGKFVSFLLALQNSLQQHVVNFILHGDRESGGNDVRPLTRTEIQNLHVNFQHLVDTMNTDEVFLTDLAARQCISITQKDALLQKSSLTDRNKLLMDILSRRSVADYNNFVRCLSDYGQSLVAIQISSEKAISSFRVAFKGKEADLLHLISLEDGSPVLVHLKAKGIVGKFQIDTIRACPTNVDRVDKLISLLERSDDSLFKPFVQVLRDCDCTRAADLIDPLGKMPSSFNAAFRRVRAVLVERIHVSNDLLEELYDRDVLNMQDVRDIKVVKTECERAARLMEILERRSSNLLPAFKDALIATNQQYIWDLCSDDAAISVHTNVTSNSQIRAYFDEDFSSKLSTAAKRLRQHLPSSDINSLRARLSKTDLDEFQRDLLKRELGDKIEQALRQGYNVDLDPRVLRQLRDAFRFMLVYGAEPA